MPLRSNFWTPIFLQKSKAIGKYIIDQISGEIRESKYFSVIADEATDVSNKENLSLVIRFVDNKQTIREEFAGTIYVRKGQQD